jgi:hypothetical protein
MKIYFCEKCGISIPLQEVVGGRATARDGKTYCQGCLPRDRVESGDLKLYFCDNCKVSIPLSDVITNHAKPEGETMLCADCARLGSPERTARRERIRREMEEREESRYRLHFCDGCNTSIPQSHIVTGRSVIRDGRTYCERCKTRVERRSVSVVVPVLCVALVVAVLGAGFLIAGGPRLLTGSTSDESSRSREELIRQEVMAAVAKSGEEKVREVDSRLSELMGRIEDLSTREQVLSRSLEALRETAGEAVRREAAFRAEVEGRLEAEETAFRKALDRLDALATRLSEERPAAPPGVILPGGGTGPAVEVPPAGPEPPAEGEKPVLPTDGGKPVPPPEPEAPEAVKEQLRQLESSDEGTRFGAAVQLGKSGWAGAAGPLGEVLAKDKDTFVRRAAARALGELGVWISVPVLIDTLEDKEYFVAVAAHKALIEITGQDFGYQENLSRTQLRKVVQKAREWWDAHQNDR